MVRTVRRFARLFAVALFPAAMAAQAAGNIASNYNQPSTSSRSWGHELPFTQKFTAQATGVPTELWVWMGSNQQPFAVMLTIEVNGTKAFEHNYTRVKQRTSDWAAVLALTGMTTTIKRGDHVSLRLVPDQQISMSPVMADNPLWPRAELKGNGLVALHFAMKTGPHAILTFSKNEGGTVSGAFNGGTMECGTDCGVSVAVNTPITLTAKPGSNQKVVAWSGGCSGTGLTCTLPMAAATTAAVEFGAIANTIKITINGGGMVSIEGGPTCPSSCTQSVPALKAVYFGAPNSSNNEWTWDTWGGDCAGKVNCTLDMTKGPHEITANFKKVFAPTLTVTPAVGGQVWGPAALIQCGKIGDTDYWKCSWKFRMGEQYTLQADDNPGYRGHTWGGDCASAGTALKCSLTMSSDKKVSIVFKPITQ
jgi:hypothetical protein